MGRFLLMLLLCLPLPSNQDPAGRPAGRVRTDARGVEQVWVTPGTFMMGTSAGEAAAVLAQSPPDFVKNELPSEQPKHSVVLTRGYWIDRFEVTNAAFKKFIDDSGYYKMNYWSAEGAQWLSKQPPNMRPYRTGKEIPEHPRVYVTWYEAEAYANWRSGRLPTEAEWEYAARGSQSTVYPWGDAFDTARANVVQTHSLTPVGVYPGGASWVGAMDMAGNAMEWVHDWLAAHVVADSIDPHGPANGSIKIEKGGWWGSNIFVARSAYRHFEDPPSYRDGHIGFRVISLN